MSYIGKIIGGNEGWICRLVWRDGMYCDYWGETKQEATDSMNRQRGNDPTVFYAQLFEYIPKPPKCTKGALVTEYDRYTDIYKNADNHL